MAQLVSQSSVSNTQRKPLIIGGLILAVFVVMAFWGGLPPAQEIPKFVIGVIALAVVGVGIGALGWYLLFRPVPYAIVQRSPLTAVHRQIIGLLLIITASLESIGGTWDEAWHTRYGIPFGKDFFWRPHILIYTGLMAIIVLGGFGWSALVSRGKGTWVQRFRGDPMLGVLILTGLFMFFAVPSDPIWHGIYGNDLSAFSIPHVLLTLLFILTFLAGTGLLISSGPTRLWQSVLHFNLRDILPLVALTFLLLSPMTLLTVDWYGLKPSDLAQSGNLVFQRPDWLFSVFVLFMATWVGTLANHMLRYFGAATLVGIAAFLARLVLVHVVNSPLPNANTWLLCLPPMIAIDVLYAVQITRKQPLKWWMAGLAASVGSLATLLLINSLMLYPQVTLANLPGMIVFPTLAALMGAWVGVSVGDYLAAQSKQPAVTQPETSALPRWVTPLLLAGTLVFMAWFIATAPPPFWAS